MYVKKKVVVLLVLNVLLANFGVSQTTQSNGAKDTTRGLKIGKLVEMSGNWFLAYRDGIAQTQADEITPATKERNSSFVLKRSYFTLKKELNDVFAVRYTMDLTVDSEGEDAGNVETRLKYLYTVIKPRIQNKNITGTAIEVGMVHRPWLDYEQKINSYRVQDNMFIERNKIFNSADFGITLTGNIGPKMDKKFLDEVNSAMKGKYMSYSIGIYNGGGYSGAEYNTNKVVAARLSFRPFANLIPEIQVSGYFNVGKGNTEWSPDFNQVLGMLAYTGKQITCTGQFHFGRGDFRGKYVLEDDSSFALKNSGFSAFGEYKIKKTNFAIWGRYDSFVVQDVVEDKTERLIGGLTYRVNKNLRLVLDYEHSIHGAEKFDIYEANLEISF